jgi:hypothetical protein
MASERERDERQERGDRQGGDRLHKLDAAQHDRPDSTAQHAEGQKAEEDRAKRFAVPHYCLT